ncbi:MAG: hypothetical protein ABI726_08375 [bacterium]
MGAWSRLVKRMEKREAEPADPNVLKPTRGRGSEALIEPAWDESKPLGGDEADSEPVTPETVRRQRERARQRWLGIGR